MSGKAESGDKDFLSLLWRHLQRRIDPLSSAVYAFPLLLIYQVGILSGRGQNGVDFVTKALVELGRRDVGNYLMIMGGMLAVYTAVLLLLRKRGKFTIRAFLPMLAESTFYALLMGSLIMFIIGQFTRVVPGLVVGVENPLDILVISAGAGFHEELIFRLGLMGGLGWLLTGLTGDKRKWIAWAIALGVSSVLFSLAHHIGPAGEDFTFMAFVYRTLAGVFFAFVYHLRGFAVAAWTHALYDVYVLSLSAG